MEVVKAVSYQKIISYHETTMFDIVVGLWEILRVEMSEIGDVKA